jgi:hypothetical protein
MVSRKYVGLYQRWVNEVFLWFLPFEFYPAIGRPDLDVKTTVQYLRGIDEGMLLTESLIGGAIFTNQIFEFSFS